MKKLIFCLMAFMLLFLVVSCDNGTKDDNPNLSQDVTPSEENNTTTETNPYEELEKSLTVKLNSIDEVEFSDGEWEFYFSDYNNYGTESEKGEYEAKMTVKEDSVTRFIDDYCKITLQFLYEDDYIDAKEDYSGEKDFSYNDEKRIITYSDPLSGETIEKYEQFINFLSWWFQEDYNDETEDYCETETYLVKTNSKKDAYLFYAETKYEDYEDSEYNEGRITKYIFKKIK